MKIFLHNKSVFEVKAEAVVLPMDLTAKNMGGSIVRQFQKIIGETDWLDIEAQVEFPYPNGRMQVANVISSHVPYKEAVFLGSLTHSPEHNPVAIMRSAFDMACEWVGRMTVQGLATPLLTGGHRVNSVLALQTMLSVADRYHKGELHIAIPDARTYALAQPLVG